MPEIGQNLAHYSIVEKIGKGGMGEVFRAKDQKLGREVAIKVLPEEFAKDTDRVARFQREAKLLASLNHPNIAVIHGLEESGGIQFLVLELVEGETLADRIKTGPIPVEESLKLALQIAEALEAAHEKGVVHRDLKPANIKVTPEGKVKVLDFGLAKAFAGEQSELNLSNSPTLTRSPTLSDAATQQGVILGTAAYMSPEQARGKSVDKRADVWAFGCVLYEMLTGRSLFAGDDVSQTLARVLERQPDFSALPTNLNPKIIEMLQRCLVKEAKDRCHDIADVRIDIQEVLANPSGVLVQPITALEHRTKLLSILLWVATALVLGLIIAGVAVWKLKPSEPRPVTRLYYELPKDQQFDILFERALAVSPDGRQLVYSTSGPLYLRFMNELDANPLPGTEGAQKPFFSPDGKWVGYLSAANNQLKKIAISGGPAVTLADVDPIGSFSWGADNTIVYGQRGRGIMRVSASGGTPEQIIKAAENDIFIHPQTLPDGKSVLFTRINPAPIKAIVQSLKSGDRKELFEGGDACYLPTGHIVYASGDSLIAIEFDPNVVRTKGGPIAMLGGISKAGGALQYDVSDSGTLAYIPRVLIGAGERTLVWVDRKGKEEPLAATPKDYRFPRISPDGTRAALAIQNAANSDIWIQDLIHETLSRLTFDGAGNRHPLWTPDGKRIAFSSIRTEGTSRVYWRAADGTGKDEFLGFSPAAGIYPSSWSGDGKTLVVMEANIRSGTMRVGIGALPMEGDHKMRPLLTEKYNVYQPQMSPNGRWMAYSSNESGKNEVYVRPFPEVDSGGRWQVSTKGGDSPLWSLDGRELFYRSGDAVLAVSVQTDSNFSFETPKTLFRGTYVPFSSGDAHPWDISPDGKRFLMMKPMQSTEKAPEAEVPRRINIVLNWFEELKQRVPVK